MIILRIFLIFFVLIQHSYAANLGFLQVNSYLNQPLNAEIKIIKDKYYPAEQIKVVHASKEDYKKFNIVKNFRFSKINLSIKEKENNELIVVLTTEKPIKEPLVSLVLTLRWPEGNLSKDFNFFLYPIEKPEAKKAIELVVPVSGKNNVQNTQYQTVNKRNKSFDPNEYRPDIQFDLEAFPAEYIYGPVDYGNSISLVAKKLRKDTTYSIQKIAKLLYLMNPSAFVNGDINRLISHTNLKVPNLKKEQLKKKKYIKFSKTNKASKDKAKLVPIDNFDIYSSNETNEVEQVQQIGEINDNIDKLPVEKTEPVSNKPGLSLLPADMSENNDVEAKTKDNFSTNNQSDEKVDILETENTILRQQFEVLMQKMELVLKKNQELDQQIKQIALDNQTPENVQESQTQQVVSETNDKLTEPLESAKQTIQNEENNKSDAKVAENKKQSSKPKPAAVAVETVIPPTKTSWVYILHDNIFLIILILILVLFAVFVALNQKIIKEKLSPILASMKKKPVEDFDLESVVPNFDEQKESVIKKNKAPANGNHDAFVADVIDHSNDQLEDINFIDNTEKTDSKNVFMSAVQRGSTDDLDAIMEEVASGKKPKNKVPVEQEYGLPLAASEEQSDTEEYGLPLAENNEQSDSEGYGLQLNESDSDNVSNIEIQDKQFSDTHLNEETAELIDLDLTNFGDDEILPEADEGFDQSFGLGMSNTDDSEQSLNTIDDSSEQSTDSSSSASPDFDNILSTKKAKTDNVDILSQASVYFAYGKFDEAESLIKSGLDNIPDDRNLKLKLFECYAKKDDEESFLLIMGEARSFIESDPDFKSKISDFYKNRWDKNLFS
ncbi:MAG: hypothetical protein HQL46_04700 [Gammaproteobacteria bacterium]|nr:hypothetical protein [Gammaproteobacteria bacterium]